MSVMSEFAKVVTFTFIYFIIQSILFNLCEQHLEIIVLWNFITQYNTQSDGQSTGFSKVYNYCHIFIIGRTTPNTNQCIIKVKFAGVVSKRDSAIKIRNSISAWIFCSNSLSFGISNHLLRTGEDILEPQNLTGAAVKFLKFTLVHCNYVYADLKISWHYTLKLQFFVAHPMIFFSHFGNF